MRKIVSIGLLAIFAATAAADIKVTRQPGYWTWAQAGVDSPNEFKTEEECVAAVKAALGGEMQTCHRFDRVYIEGLCVDVPAPKPFTSETRQVACPNLPGYEYPEESYQRRHDSLFPTCWETAWRAVGVCPDPVTP